MESKLEILANIAQALEKTRAALDDGIDEPGEQELAKHREELDALIAAVRQREAQVRTRSIQRYETALRVLRANPSAKAKAELGEAFDSLRKLWKNEPIFDRRSRRERLFLCSPPYKVQVRGHTT